MPATNTVTYDSTYVFLATTSRDGYTLSGWYTANSGGTKIETTSTVATASNHLLYALWTANNATAYKTEHYKQNLNDAGYTLFETENLSGVTDTSATAVYKTYTGFTKDESNANTVASGTIAGNGSLALKLYYTRNTYTVAFASNGGSSVSDLTNQKYGAKIDKPNDPTRQGYTFSGWYKEAGLTTAWNFASDTVEDTTTLYAKWTADSYAITYTLNGGTNASSNPATYTIETPTITLAEPTKTHYTFDGWYTSSAFLGSPVASILEGSTGAKAFYAKWTPTSYTITYDLDGGTNAVTNPPSYTIETTTITLDDPTKTHYDFWGWYETSSFSGTPITAIDTGSSGAKTLYAKWLPTYYLVIFKANGGSSFMDDQSIRYTYQATLDANAFTLTGYSFTGWNTQADGSGTSYADQANYSIGAANATLYAKWTPLTISIAFDEEGETTTSPETIYRDYNTAYGTLPTTTRTGYTFAGWWTGDNGTGTQVLSTTTVTATNWHTLYAKWTPNTNTAYKVEHYQQDVSGSGYTLFETENKTGTTATQVTATAKTYADFNYNNSLSPASGTIAANGSLVLRLYYDRKTYTVTFQSNGGSAVTAYTGIRHGATISAPADPTKSGYVFNLWYVDSSLTQRFDFATQTITADTTLYAKWWSGGVGDLGPAGGVVFHDKGVYSDGWRYLEAASTDVVDAYHKGETTYEWGGKTTYLYHINYTLIGTSLAIGTGEANSLAMIAALSKYSYIYSGADLCREVYRQGGYADWFLPSVLELDQMARLTDAKAGSFTLLSGVYWSSSESSSTNAYLYDSAGKSYSPMPKEYLFRLRAVRAF